MPFADIPAEFAFVGSESVAVARQPVGLVVEHVVTLRAVGHASTGADDVALSPCPPPTANKALDPTAWAFLFFSELSMVRHLVSPVEFSPAHAAGQLGRCAASSFGSSLVIIALILSLRRVACAPRSGYAQTHR